MKKYKVISQRDKWFSGKFDPLMLENRLNELAADGWRVVSMTTASREGALLGGDRDELLVLLEKEAGKAAEPSRMTAAEDGVYRL
jgi:hypothetical protein